MLYGRGALRFLLLDKVAIREKAVLQRLCKTAKALIKVLFRLEKDCLAILFYSLRDFVVQHCVLVMTVEITKPIRMLLRSAILHRLGLHLSDEPVDAEEVCLQHHARKEVGIGLRQEHGVVPHAREQHLECIRVAI